jgi:hypothetical protein
MSVVVNVFEPLLTITEKYCPAANMNVAEFETATLLTSVDVS